VLHQKSALSGLAAALFGMALSLALTPAVAQDAQKPAPSWIDPALLAAAKAEGSLIVYSSTNEEEGLPMWKMFEDATGIKVSYIRASDSVLMGRIAVEFRAGQASYDVISTTTVNKIPPELVAQFDPLEARNLIPRARDPNRRWYGVYANYNTPAYNTQKIKSSELPQTYEELATRKEWAGKVAIDGSDNEWLKAMFTHFGEERATKLITDLVTNLNVVVTDGHLALARSVGSGEYWMSLNNYVALSMNVKINKGAIDVWAMDPVALFFGQVGVNIKAPHPNAARLGANFLISREAQTFEAKYGRLPTRPDVEGNPPGVLEMINKKKIVSALLAPDEEKKWQKLYETLVKRR
jgi:iron(III) transport system substrate-binding protein